MKPIPKPNPQFFNFVTDIRVLLLTYILSLRFPSHLIFFVNQIIPLLVVALRIILLTWRSIMGLDVEMQLNLEP